MRTKRVERLLMLMQALRSGVPRTVDELAELNGVSRRTVFRDLELFGRVGLRFSYCRETGRYTTDRDALLPPLSFTHAEALTLVLATRSISRRSFVSDIAAARTVRTKLESMLPSEMSDYLGSIAETVEIRDGPASDAATVSDTLALIQGALSTQNKIKATYDSYYDKKVIEVVIHPYRLAYIHRGWYVIGLTEGIGEVRTYKVERIVRLATLEDTFVAATNFSLDDYFGNAWLLIRGDRSFHVKIRFHPSVAGNVDEIAWHKTQSTSYLQDGSLLFEVDVDGVEEISWWVLGYGDRAEVLEPGELRELLGERAARMMAFYDGHGRGPKVPED